MFLDTKNPTMAELVNWFVSRFPNVVVEMRESNHAAVENEANPYHIEGSVWAHTMMVCLQADNDSANKVNKVCALLHDIGKPASREVIPFNKPKPVHTESNEVRNNNEKSIDEMTEEELIEKYPKEYKAYLESIRK